MKALSNNFLTINIGKEHSTLMTRGVGTETFYRQEHKYVSSMTYRYRTLYRYVSNSNLT